MFLNSQEKKSCHVSYILFSFVLVMWSDDKATGFHFLFYLCSQDKILSLEYCRRCGDECRSIFFFFSTTASSLFSWNLFTLSKSSSLHTQAGKNFDHLGKLIIFVDLSLKSRVTDSLHFSVHFINLDKQKTSYIIFVRWTTEHLENMILKGHTKIVSHHKNFTFYLFPYIRK